MAGVVDTAFEIDEPTFSRAGAKKKRQREAKEHKERQEERVRLQEQLKQQQPKPKPKSKSKPKQGKITWQDGGFLWVGIQLENFLRTVPIGQKFVKNVHLPTNITNDASHVYHSCLDHLVVRPQTTVGELQDELEDGYFQQDDDKVSCEMVKYLLSELTRIEQDIILGQEFSNTLHFGWKKGGTLSIPLPSLSFAELMMDNLISIFRLYFAVHTLTVGQLRELLSKKKLPKMKINEDYFPW